MDFSGKHVLILGLGESGLAMARWLLRCGAKLRVADTRDLPDRLLELRALSPEIEFIGGDFLPSLLDLIDVIAVSPGLSPLRELVILMPEAKRRDIPVWGEVELFAQALAALNEKIQYQPKVIAITGTNGKTTVTSLVGLLCERAGLTVKVAGNISPAMLDVLRQALDADVLPQVWVLELSSFQLHTCFSLNADVATVLNITQDHLDWHGDIANYCEDKKRIFGLNTTQLLNRDDALVMTMCKQGDQSHSIKKTITFGVGAPKHNGDFGLLNEHGMVWLACAIADEDEQLVSRRKKKELVVVPVTISRLMPADALKIRGQHNAANALAALALCRAIGLPLAPLLHGLRDYAGEPHRVELVANVAGIDYIDDSKGTNVGATVAALKGLGQEDVNSSSGKKIILIVGGEGKGQDFSPLADPVERYTKAVLLIGKAAPEIRSAIQFVGVDLRDFSTLEETVIAASHIAQEGDIVLLSPACASLDMFRNYAHRAQVFVDAVREIALARGDVC